MKNLTSYLALLLLTLAFVMSHSSSASALPPGGDPPMFYPDLQIVSITPSINYSDGVVSFTVRVGNGSLAPTPGTTSIEVDVIVDGSVVGTTTIPGPIPDESTTTVTIDTTIMVQGAHGVTIAVDQSPNRIQELNENNNTRSGVLTIGCGTSKACPQYGWSG